MTNAEFARRVCNTRMRLDDIAAQACQLVLCDGLTAYAVSKATGISQSQISRALRVIKAAKPADTCPHCGTKL